MNYTYKPGWTLTMNGDVIHITAPAVSAYTGEPYGLTYTLGCDGSPEGVMAVLARLEHHELREFFRVDGKQFDPPHAPGVDPDSGTV